MIIDDPRDVELVYATEVSTGGGGWRREHTRLVQKVANRKISCGIPREGNMMTKPMNVALYTAMRRSLGLFRFVPVCPWVVVLVRFPIYMLYLYFLFKNSLGIDIEIRV